LTPATHAMVVYNKLTAREKEVFKLMVKGRSRKVLAETLSISPKTVDRHRCNLMEKLNLRKEAEILQFAKLIGLMET
jgi:DNA-binding NarL/FixJ family response regulator